MHALKEIEDTEMRFHDDVLEGSLCLWSWRADCGRQNGLEALPRLGRRSWLRRAAWGGILAPCLGVLTPIPEAGGSEDRLFIWEVLIWGFCVDTRSTGGKRGLEWEIWVSPACNGNRRGSRMGWRP